MVVSPGFVSESGVLGESGVNSSPKGRDLAGVACCDGRLAAEVAGKDRVIADCASRGGGSVGVCKKARQVTTIGIVAESVIVNSTGGLFFTIIAV